jgi:hypothetical protein
MFFLRFALCSIFAAAAVLAPTAGSADAAAAANIAAAGVSANARDWLVDTRGFVARAERSADGSHLVLTNGLTSRTFKLAPNVATVALSELRSGHNHVRAVRPEARVVLDGAAYDVGGLNGQSVQNYLLPEFEKNFSANPNAFRFTHYTTRKIQPRLAWKQRTEWLPKESAANAPWPPPGIELQLHFSPPENNKKLNGTSIVVHYELYDGIPLFCKWLTVKNASAKTVVVNRFTSEILAAVEGGGDVENQNGWTIPNIYVETDYAFMQSMFGDGKNIFGAYWEKDPTFKTQISWSLLTRCLLEVRPPKGPEQSVATGETFESFRAWELIYDSFDKQRNTLAKMKMYRTIAPWSQENPVMMHVRNADEKSVKRAIDQCVQVGFELVILTFGSGFDMEESRPAELQKKKALADYAHSKGIALGGYSLFSSRRISEKDDVVNPKTGKRGGFATFGNAPCLESEWGINYLKKLRNTIEKTGFDLLENDGPYPGDFCASQKHPGHKSLDDSQWTQWRRSAELYKWCRARGVYLNLPDWYYLVGGNKNAMGYRETNWSLPRAQQEIIERQNIFDGTREKTPSMGWMFVPLTQYHGGGAAATIEPLDAHFDHYESRLANLFGAGVQACFRGPRIYDTERVKTLVAKWVTFYKKHRAILDSDIIHLRRADGRDWDGILHVNPRLKERGLLFIYNPLSTPIEREITVPLYYTGLTTTAIAREQETGTATALTLARDYTVKLKVKIPARSHTWFVFGEKGGWDAHLAFSTKIETLTPPWATPLGLWCIVAVTQGRRSFLTPTLGFVGQPRWGCDTAKNTC